MLLQRSALEIKAFNEGQIGGNRWYQAKSDTIAVFSVNTKPLKVFSRHETYVQRSSACKHGQCCDMSQ